MCELTDLEICKRIGEIEGHEVIISHGRVIKYLKVQVVCSVRPTETYNPLTDDSLCFRLMIKYDVVREWEPYDMLGWNYWCRDAKSPVRTLEVGGNKDFKTEISPNKAICLAIIHAHKDNIKDE